MQRLLFNWHVKGEVGWLEKDWRSQDNGKLEISTVEGQMERKMAAGENFTVKNKIDWR